MSGTATATVRLTRQVAGGVSVVIPTIDGREQLLERALASVAVQTRPADDGRQGSPARSGGRTRDPRPGSR